MKTPKTAHGLELEPLPPELVEALAEEIAEALILDFQGDAEAVAHVMGESPGGRNHDPETD